MFADRILIRPEALRKLRVDDRDLVWRGGKVLFGEGAALYERNAHRAKVIRARAPAIHLELFARSRLEPLDVDPAPADRRRERQRGDESRGLHAWHAGDAALEVLVVLDRGGTVRELHAGDTEPHGNHAIGREPWPHAVQAHEAADEEARGNQEHHGKRDFRRHEQAAGAEARQAETAVSLNAAAAGFERVVHVAAGRSERGRQAKQQPGQQREDERKHEDAAVQANGFEPGDVARIDRARDLEAHLGDGQPEGPADERDRRAFEEQLPDDAGAIGAERRPDRDFPPAARGARQQQIRDIRTGDEKHQADRSEQHQDRLARVADDLIEQRHDADREALVPLVLLANTARRGADVGLRLRHGQHPASGAPSSCSSRRRAAARRRRRMAAAERRPSAGCWRPSS